MLKVGIIGATGYTGEELIKILINHQDVKITVLQRANIENPVPISSIFPRFYGNYEIICEKIDFEKASKKADIFFLSLPHTISMTGVPIFLKNKKKVIDLSADYRLNLKEYEKWYKVKHQDSFNIKKAIYGLPELFRKEIKNAELIANPGCYSTSIILGLIPLLKKNLIKLNNIIVDSKSGVTGAGKKTDVSLLFSEVNESFKAYKVNEHQHKPEINMLIEKITNSKTDITFVPHLIPMDRGMLSTIYLDLKEKIDTTKAIEIYKNFYKNEPFVNILDQGFPRTKDVQNTNFCNIAIKVSGKRIIVISAIDNLVKGASGQAVQNMNIICGFNEKQGLL